MSAAIVVQIDLPPESQALIKQYAAAPGELPLAIKRGMDRALAIVAKRIVSKRLIGKGPYPPAQHRLGQRTGQLSQSVRFEPAVVSGNEVVGAIGSPVVYARVHEFGFQGQVHVTSKTGKSFTRRMNMPERAPFRTEIDENRDYIADEIGKEVADSLTA